MRIARVLERKPDDNRSRDDNTDDEQRQQPEREVEEVRDRAREGRAMSGDLGGRLGDLDEVLDAHSYPISTNELVEAYGDYEIETQGGTESLEEVLAPTDDQTYDSAMMFEVEYWDRYIGNESACDVVDHRYGLVSLTVRSEEYDLRQSKEYEESEDISRSRNEDSRRRCRIVPESIQYEWNERAEESGDDEIQDHRDADDHP